MSQEKRINNTLQNKMDMIVSSVCSNVLNQRKINGQIELVDFVPDDYGHLVYLECAQMIGKLHNEQVYTNLSFGQYIKLLFKNWGSRKTLKRVKELKGKDKIDDILAYVCKVHQINYTFYNKIYKEYYEVTK